MQAVVTRLEQRPFAPSVFASALQPVCLSVEFLCEESTLCPDAVPDLPPRERVVVVHDVAGRQVGAVSTCPVRGTLCVGALLGSHPVVVCVFPPPPPQSPWCGLLLAVHNDVLDGGPPDLPSWTADVFARGTLYHVPAHSVTRYLPGAATVAAGALLAAAFTTCSPQEADEGVMGPQLQLPYSR